MHEYPLNVNMCTHIDTSKKIKRLFAASFNMSYQMPMNCWEQSIVEIISYRKYYFHIPQPECFYFYFFKKVQYPSTFHYMLSKDKHHPFFVK